MLLKEKFLREAHRSDVTEDRPLTGTWASPQRAAQYDKNKYAEICSGSLTMTGVRTAPSRVLHKSVPQESDCSASLLLGDGSCAMTKPCDDPGRAHHKTSRAGESSRRVHPVSRTTMRGATRRHHASSKTRSTANERGLGAASRSAWPLARWPLLSRPSQQANVVGP